MEFTVMTFNLRTFTGRDGDNVWPNRFRRVARTIEDIAPSVIGVQEAHREMLHDLEPLLQNYRWLGEGREVGLTGELCAIWYNEAEIGIKEQGQFWLSEEPDRVGSRGWDGQCTRICTWARMYLKAEPRNEFYMFNTHLDHRGQIARENGIALIWRKISERRAALALPAVLTGDFNVTPDNPVIRFMRGLQELDGERAQMTDAYTALEGAPGATYHGFRGGSEGEPIDYIFVTPDVRVLHTAIDRRTIDGGYPSDHYPVIARIRLP
jgi:endonuclease/exonuclease/phosphatase family metal-dependent hydrolase